MPSSEIKEPNIALTDMVFFLFSFGENDPCFVRTRSMLASFVMKIPIDESMKTDSLNPPPYLDCKNERDTCKVT
mgnify:CR=1 FL=1